MEGKDSREKIVWRLLVDAIERIDKEINRRSRVVGILPNNAAVIRLGAIRLDMHDEWLAAKGRYLSEASDVGGMAVPGNRYRL
jgi:transposase-like protein